jgi:hypothetical protein
VRGAQLSVGVLAARGELPLEQWREVHAAAAAVRRARTALTGGGEPCHALARYEAALPPIEAAMAALLVLHHLGGYLDCAIVRGGVDARVWLELGEALRLLVSDPVQQFELLRSFAALTSPLYAKGVVEEPDGDERAVDARRRDLIPARAFLDECLGIPLDQLGCADGVQVLRPDDSLDDVVLAPEIAERLRALDLGAAVRQAGARRGNALGILLHGPSGTGKTMLAKALAGEAGAALVAIDAAALKRRDELPRVISASLRLAAAQHALVFIDEADDVVGQATEAGRALLTGLEAHPCVAVLATNEPHRLDPALDRRLQVKLRLDIPPPPQRAAILRRELRGCGRAAEPGLLESPALDRLAETYRFAGGYWRNVAQLAALGAAARGPAAPVVLDDLSRAALGQVRLLDDRAHAGCAWAGALTPLGAGLLGARRRVEVARAAAALDELRAANARRGRHGLGVLVLVTGEEPQLAREAAEGIAHALALPLALLTRRDVRTRDGDVERVTPDERLLDELGEVAACYTSLGREHTEGWLPLLARVPRSRHLVIAHAPAAAPPAIRRLAALAAPWAVLDAETAGIAWARLGGVGAAPAAESLAELSTVHARQRLAGIIGGGEGAAELP